MHLRLLSRFRNKPIFIPGTDLALRIPTANDYDRWRAVRTESKAFLSPWEPSWPADDLTRIGYQRRLKAYHKQRQAGWGRTFFLMDESSQELLGGISLTRITHRVSRSATLGYWMGVKHAGKGHMKKAVPSLLSYAFSDLNLNRVEAACVPRNERSIYLLESCGFRKEGFAREYLEINGVMEDHILFAKLRTDH